MSATFDVIINEMVNGAITTIFNLLKVLIPLMIIVEILMVYKIIEKVATKLEGFGKIMGMSKNAVFPLLVAVFMVLPMGPGLLLKSIKERPFQEKTWHWSQFSCTYVTASLKLDFCFMWRGQMF